MDIQDLFKSWKWQVVYSFLLYSWVSGQLHYSIFEESEPGTVVGNVAQDLEINIVNIGKHRLHLGPESRSRYFSVNQGSGALIVKERIDRESLCGSSLSCLLHVELIIETPVQLFSLEIEILDINDNSPKFSTTDLVLRITELVTSPGVRFPLETAQDADVGINDVKQYILNPTPYFSLSVKNRKDGTLVPELVLETYLDREEKREHKLILSALDGDKQPRSGTLQITVIVVDINDNAPQFEHSVYKVNVFENVPLKTIIIMLNATDFDEGSNAEIEYFLDRHASDTAKELFGINIDTGEIYINGIVDFEESHYWELPIRAVDKGVPELEGRCLVQVEIEDVNDNSPEISFTSVTNEIPEDAALGTIIGFLVVTDRDSALNGEVHLQVFPNLPFNVKLLNNRHSLITDDFLDREKVSKYTITLIATDLGSPPLHTQIKITLNISDINDNPPVFPQICYDAFVKENNEPGNLLITVSASDLDQGVNSQLTYSIVEGKVNGFSVTSFVYINSENGNIYAQHSFDYEQIQVLNITIKAEDSGAPTLFSNVSVFIFVLDINDNYPSVLYPDRSEDLLIQEKVPKSATVGHLVTKVSAVDLDSGHNAWLLFRIAEATSPSLFQISAYTGEIRTNQILQETDNSFHKIVVIVSDHGDPSLSTEVTIFINIEDNIVYESPKSHNLPAGTKQTTDLTLYLIISLVAISLVSLVTFIILLVKCLKKDNDDSSCGACFLNKTHSKQYADKYQPTLYLNTDGTLKYMEVRMVPPESQGQCYPACFPPVSEQNDFTFKKPLNFPHLKDMVNETESSGTTCLNNSKQVR